MASKFSLEAILSLTDNLTSPYKKSVNKITALNGTLGGSFGALNNGINKTIGFIGKGMMSAATVGIGAVSVALGVATTNFIDFEKSMAKVGTIADTTTISLKEYGDQILAISNETGQAASDLAEAQYQAISAGVDSTKSAQFVSTAVKAAVGGFTDTTTAVDGLTSILNAYGMEAEKATSISDQMLATQNFGKTTFGEMAGYLGQVIPIASSLNLETTELFGSIATLTKQGIPTSQAITGIKAALSNILKPSSEATELAKSLGIEFNSTALQSKGLAKFLEGVTGKTKGNQAQMAKLFGSVEALNSVMALSKNGGADFVEAIEAITNSSGATEQAFAKMTDTLGFKWEKSKNKIVNATIKLGDAISPIVDILITKFDEINLDEVVSRIQDSIPSIKSAFESAIDIAKNAVNGFREIIDFVKEHKGAIEGLLITMGAFKLAVMLVNTVLGVQKLLMVAGGALEMIKVFMSLAKTEGVLATAQLALNVAMEANPVGLIVLAVTAAIAALIALGKIIYDNRDAIIEFFGVVKDYLIDGFNKVLPVLEAVGRGFMTFLLAPINLVLEGIQGLLTLISKIPGVGDALQPALDALQEFQDGMNTVTLLGGTATATTQTAPEQQASMNNPTSAPSLESHLQMQKEKQQRDVETKQRYDINLNAPSGWSMALPGQTPGFSVPLGDQ